MGLFRSKFSLPYFSSLFLSSYISLYIYHTKFTPGSLSLLFLTPGSAAWTIDFPISLLFHWLLILFIASSFSILLTHSSFTIFFFLHISLALAVFFRFLFILSLPIYCASAIAIFNYFHWIPAIKLINSKSFVDETECFLFSFFISSLMNINFVYFYFFFFFYIILLSMKYHLHYDVDNHKLLRNKYCI